MSDIQTFEYSCAGQPEQYALTDTEFPWKEYDYLIYWHLFNFSPDLEPYRILGAIQKAYNIYNFEFWPCQVQSTSSEDALIQVYFVKEDGKVYSNDGEYWFDCPFNFKASKAVAVQYPYLPGSRWSLCMFLDDRRVFSVMEGDGTIDLRIAFPHEIGHAFLLGHSHIRDALMYKAYTPGAKFGADDRAGLNYAHMKYRLAAIEVNPAGRLLREAILVDHESKMKHDPEYRADWTAKPLPLKDDGCGATSAIAALLFLAAFYIWLVGG